MSHTFRFLFIFACLFSSVSVSHGQVNRTLPKWAELEDISTIAEISTREVQDGYYYILAEEQYNTVEKQNLFHYATKVISEAGLSTVSQIEFDYDPSFQKASLHFLRIHRGSTVIDKTTTEEIKILDEENERSNGLLYGKRTFYINLSDVRKGDVVEYYYSTNGYNKLYDGVFNKDFWLAYSVPLGRIKYKLIFDPSVEPVIQSKNGAFTPDIKLSKTKDYTWLINDPAILTMEKDVPVWYDPYPQVQISTFKSWNEVKTWFEKLFTVKAYNDAALKIIADSIHKKYPADTEKQISACVAFVQDHIRYSGNENGIYSHLPHTPDFVLKNRFGDCKDKSLLLVELLKHFDVTAYPALLNTTLQKNILTHNPSVHRFDHCIAVIHYNNTVKFIDPTTIYQVGSFLKRPIANYETAMVLDHSSALFTTIPTDKTSGLEVEETFVIDDNGDATLKAIFKYKGSNADDMRYYFATNSSGFIQKSFQAVYNPYSDDITVMDSVKVEDNDSANVLTTFEHYLLKKFWVNKEGDKNLIVKNFTPYSVNEKMAYGLDKTRKDPFKTEYPLNIRQRIFIRKAGGFSIENNTVSESNKFFDYSYQVRNNSTILELDYRLVTKVNHVLPAEYKLYKSKTDIVDNNIVFSTQQKTVSAESNSFNWLLLLVLIITLSVAAVLCLSLYVKKFHVNYARQYESIGGWLILMGIGIALTPWILLIDVCKIYSNEFSLNYYNYFFSESSLFYDPFKGYFSLSIFVLNILLICFSILLAFVFFQRKSSFRYYFPAFKLFNLSLLLFNILINIYFYYDMTDEDVKREVSREKASIFRVALESCVWIPYIMYSERSKRTFTNGGFSEEEPTAQPWVN